MDRDGVVEHWTQIGHAWRRRGEPERAIDAYSRGARVDPDNPTCWVNLASACMEAGDVERPDQLSRQLLIMLPDYPDAHMLRGRVCEELGEHAESLSCYERAIKLVPGHALAHYARGLQLLRLGRFEEGWPEHEWRLRCADHSMPGFRFDIPIWRGENVAGRTILLHAEQGIGDTIHFARYAPLLAQRGATVILEVQRPLARLMRGLPGIRAVIGPGDALPKADLQCSLMSLALSFETTFETIPALASYLTPDPNEAAVWRDRLSRGGGAASDWSGRVTLD